MAGVPVFIDSEWGAAVLGQLQYSYMVICTSFYSAWEALGDERQLRARCRRAVE